MDRAVWTDRTCGRWGARMFRRYWLGSPCGGAVYAPCGVMQSVASGIEQGLRKGKAHRGPDW